MYNFVSFCERDLNANRFNPQSTNDPLMDHSLFGFIVKNTLLSGQCLGIMFIGHV